MMVVYKLSNGRTVAKRCHHYHFDPLHAGSVFYQAICHSLAVDTIGTEYLEDDFPECIIHIFFGEWTIVHGGEIKLGDESDCPCYLVLLPDFHYLFKKITAQDQSYPYDGRNENTFFHDLRFSGVRLLISLIQKYPL